MNFINYMYFRFSILLFLLFLTTTFTAKAQAQKAAFKELPTRTAEAVDVLINYVSIPSVTGNELEAGQFFAEYCRQKGLHITHFSTDTASYNFAATLFPLSDDKPVVWFQHHIDVVDASDVDLWTFDPFEGKLHNDTLYGRGMIDSKGLGVMQLMGLLAFKEQLDEIDEIEFNVGLLCVSAEEMGGELGSAFVLDHYLSELKPAVIFGEGGAALQGVLQSDPSRKVYGVSVAEKAALWLKLELELLSYGHGATPAPSYANKIMINSLSRLNSRKLRLDFNRTNKRMFRRLGKAEGGIRGFMIRHMNWWVLRPFVKKMVQGNPLLEALTTNTVTVTKIFNPPGPPNKIATTSTAYLDCRLQPGVNKNAFVKRIEKLLDDPRITVKVVNLAVDAKATNPDRYYEAMEEAILQTDPGSLVVPMLFPATTDNSLFRSFNIPTFGLIPAVLDQSVIESVHNVDEKLPVSALENGISVYHNLLINLLDERVRVKYKKYSLFQSLDSRH